MTVDRLQEMSQSDYAHWMSRQWIWPLWWDCHHAQHLLWGRWFISHLGWKRLQERLSCDCKVRTGYKMERKTVKDTALGLRNAGEVWMLVCLVFLAKEERHWQKFFWKLGPKEQSCCHTPESCEEQQVNRKWPELLSSSPGGSKDAWDTVHPHWQVVLIKPVVWAVPRTLLCPLSTKIPCWEAVGSKWGRISAAWQLLLTSFQEMVWLTCQVIQI